MAHWFKSINQIGQGVALYFMTRLTYVLYSESSTACLITGGATLYMGTLALAPITEETTEATGESLEITRADME